jgi:glyoxylate/hydroxypyruvate reductase A
MPNILFAARDNRWQQYKDALPRAFDAVGLTGCNLSRDHAPADTDYIVYAPSEGGLKDFTPYTNTKAVLCLWAGVEDIVSNPTLTQPLTRMVDAGLSEGMVEWVTGQTLRHHLGLDAQIVNPDHKWQAIAPPLARNRTVAILGLGALGAACGAALAALNFTVTGWSRSQKTLPGITCHSGEEGLQDVLKTAEILVLLMPLTPATENLINAQTLAQLPKGAVIINPGRGPLIDDTALLEALDTGHIAHATLDVFRQEPLPQDHPFWAHPKITVTPHIASETRPETASQVIAENIHRSEQGKALLHLVNRTTGY